MKKQDRDSVLFWSKVITFGIGVALAIAFQTTGNSVACLFGLGFFAVGFALVLVTSIQEVVYLFSKGEAKSKAIDEPHFEEQPAGDSLGLKENEENSQNSEQKQEKPEDEKELRMKKAFAILKTCLSFAMLVFVLVVMILF